MGRVLRRVLELREGDCVDIERGDVENGGGRGDGRGVARRRNTAA